MGTMQHVSGRMISSIRVCVTSLLFLLLSGGDLESRQAPPPPSPAQDPAPTKASPSAWKQQKATMASLKAIAAAWETYFNDFSTYCPPKKTAPEPQWDNLKPEELRGILVPTYIERLPLDDGWGRPLQFRVRCDATGLQAYGIRSGGGDGRWDPAPPSPAPDATAPSADIVFADGVFLQSPAGLPR